MRQKILVFLGAPWSVRVHEPQYSKDVVQISLYARSDLMSVSIPVTSGGCGKLHSRPVAKGIAKRVWELNCPDCEKYLRGDGKPKVIRVSGGDKNKGIPSRMDHVTDSDPHWSTTPETIPPTPDEEKVHSVRAELGKEQLAMINSFAAAKQAGIEIPREAWWLLEQNFDPKILQGQIQCLEGHNNPSGTKFCGECGVGMNVQAALKAAKHDEAPFVGPGHPSDDALDSLDLRTLRQMCKDQGLPTSGNKKQLVERLA
jgi:hypothetical protein